MFVCVGSMFVFVFQMLLIICSTKPKSARLVPGRSSHSSNPVLRKNSSREKRHHQHSHSGAHSKTMTTRRSSQSSQKSEQQLHRRRSSRNSMTEEDYKAKIAKYKEKAALRKAERASRVKELSKLESSSLGTKHAAEQYAGTTERLLEKYQKQNERLKFDTKGAERKAERRLTKRLERTFGIKILDEPSAMETSQEMYEAAQEKTSKMKEDIKQGFNHLFGVKTTEEKEMELHDQIRKKHLKQKYLDKYSN